MGRNGVRAPLRTPAWQANVLTTLQQTLTQSLFMCFGGEKKIGGLVEARAGSHGKGRRKNNRGHATQLQFRTAALRSKKPMKSKSFFKH